MLTQEKIKIAVSVAGIVTLLTFAVSAFIYVKAYDRSTVYSAPSISVSGTGKIIASPDVARFNYSIITESGKDIKNSKIDNDKKSTAIVDFLKKQGVPEEDIKTTSYKMTPRYQSYNCLTPLRVSVVEETSISSNSRACPPPTIAGYTFNTAVEVTLRDFAKQDLNQLVSGVVDAGANNVSALRFELADPSSARTLVKAQAIRKAMDQAKQLAKTGGFSLGRLLAIDEQGGGGIYYEKATLGIGGSADSLSLPTSVPTLPVGSQEISITVTLRYSLD